MANCCRTSRKRNDGLLFLLRAMKVSESLKEQVGGSHYKGFKIQPVEYCHANGLGFLEGNVIKYVTRHKEKNGREDLLKARHFLNMLLDLEYPEEKEVPKSIEQMNKEAMEKEIQNQTFIYSPEGIREHLEQFPNFTIQNVKPFGHGLDVEKKQ